MSYLYQEDIDAIIEENTNHLRKMLENKQITQEYFEAEVASLPEWVETMLNT